MKIKKFPIVMKNAKEGKITIIYRNRVEFYNLNGKDIISDPYNELSMAEGCNYVHVNTIEEEEIN